MKCVPGRSEENLVIVYFERRRRIGEDLYKVRTWLLFGVVPVYRRYEQLTVRGREATASERNP